MENVDKQNVTIKGAAKACATAAPADSPIDKLIEEHAQAEAAVQQNDDGARINQVGELERLIAGFRCRSVADMATKINFMLSLAARDESEEEYLGRYGPAILNSMLDAPDYCASRDRAAFDKMTPRQKQIVSTALNGVRETLLGIMNRPNVDDMVHEYVEDLWDQTNGRLDTLCTSLSQDRPHSDKERAEWFAAVISFCGKLEWDAADIAYEFPELFEQVRSVGIGNGVSGRIAQLDRLARNYQCALDLCDGATDGEYICWSKRADEVEKAIYEFRCRTIQEVERKASILADIVKRGDNQEHELGQYGSALLKSMLPDDGSNPKAAAPKTDLPKETGAGRNVSRGLSDLEDFENQLLKCLDGTAVQQERGEHTARDKEGYELLFKIQCDVGEVIASRQEARTIAEAMRPCKSIADIKDRVALLLAASWENMEEGALNDVYTAVRNSILTFAREISAT